MSLRQKAVGGMVWTISQQFGVRIISFIVSIILARLLDPATFGLFGMISILMTLGSTLMDSGLTSSLIRTPNPQQNDFSTVFFINLFGSIIIYCLAFFIAPYVAAFYDQPVLTNIIRVFCTVFIINAFNGIQRARLTIDMNFKAQMMVQVPSVIIGGIFGIILAYKGFGVWSLVYMYLMQSTLSTLQFWFGSKWRPNLYFGRKIFWHHFQFGYKITLSGVIVTLYNNIYTILIAKYFSASQLGYYSRALSLRDMPISNLSAALNKVTYPIFSAIHNDDAKLKSAYKRVMQQVVFCIAPLLVFLVVMAEPFIRILLTEKWLPAVPYFQILCIAGFWLPLQSYNHNIIKVKGNTGLILKLQIVKKIFGVIGVVSILHFGIIALLYFHIVSTLVDYLLDAKYGGGMINYSVWDQIRDIAPIIFVSIFSGLLIWAVDIFISGNLFNMSDFFRLLVGVVMYFTVFALISVKMKIPALFEFKGMIKKARV